MNSFANEKRRLFVARPWNAATDSLYKVVIEKLSFEWNITDGTKQYKENKDQADREMFISRNQQLYEKIVSGIQKADVFIADVTNANANVMLELGIAIQLNKNVIIVTGEDINRLPFDIRGFHTERYTNADDLISKIKASLSIYLNIKRQTFEPNKYFPENYKHIDNVILTADHAVKEIELPKLIKNLKIKLEYKFLDVSDNIDWLGIHLRASPVSVQPSELVYVRKNENLEIVTLPTRQTPVLGKDKSTREGLGDDGFSRLELTLDGNNLFAETSLKELPDDSIQLETFGKIYLQANAHGKERGKLKIEVKNIEIINLDTINVS